MVANVQDLILEMRKVMSPHTATNLREKRFETRHNPYHSLIHLFEHKFIAIVHYLSFESSVLFNHLSLLTMYLSTGLIV